jgi:protein-disulfide isomerase
VVAFGISKRELRIFLERSLRTKEKELFLNLYELQGITFSSAVRKIVEENYPESTVKVILQRLKKFNLIDFGNHDFKGKPLVFTDLGNTFFEILRGE